MFDAHTHIQDTRFLPYFPEVIDAAATAGIRGLCACATAPADWEATAALIRCTLPIRIVPAFGVHPWFLSALPDEWCDMLEDLLLRYSGAALGEVGLDGVHKDIPLVLQEQVLDRQLVLAVRLNRPVVLHGARAWDGVLTRLAPYASRLSGMMAHGFGGSAEQLKRWLALGGYVSINGSVCHPCATRMRAVAQAVPDFRLLVETDAPCLFPNSGVSAGIDQTGQPLNQPANLVAVVMEVARLRGVSKDLLSETTCENAMRFFGLKK